jgi:hypothetical protein
MVEGVTAEFFVEPEVEALAIAIQNALRRKWNGDALRANAARFSPQNFRRALGASISSAMSQLS